MKKITLTLSDDAYEILSDAVLEHDQTVKEWLEHELNNNTDAIVEMLLADW
jgi:hypothetical protein